MSVFALDALTVSPCCSMLFATVGPGGLPGRHMLWGPSQLLGGQTELMGPLPVGSSMSGVEGNQECPSHLAQPLAQHKCSSTCPSGAEPGPPLYPPADKPLPCHQWGWVGCRADYPPCCPLCPSLLTVSLDHARRTTTSTIPPWPAARPTRPGLRGCDPAWCMWYRCEPAPWPATASTVGKCASRH